ncbi:sensor histidine kinase [Paraglaciecola arctica]|uniref:histidine kinase n=1 Tax=Paraglaciecola arctica BSs20135 TaxID=493475 RepID=K6ZBL4_9ALTE|nr:ATP-binding protein [Paraglaciecola arctica]GAC20790.1 response regulator receiver domain-containing protein [Paraglaciecola arctica BSs20135]
MGFKKFSLFIAIRTIFVMLNLLLLSVLISAEGYHATILIVFVLLVLQSLSLVRFVSKTNAELVRFLDAARYADYSQRFDLSSLGSGFGELGSAFTDILERFQRARSAQEEQQRHLKAIVEHAPVPLLSISSDGLLTLWNNAARKLFGANHVTKLSDLAPFGEEFAKHLATVKPGERRLVNFTIDGMEYQLSISATQILLPKNQEILVSMQDIQSELDIAQLQAWQDLVKVLTHEIMNSITPVASLAKTTVDLVADCKHKADSFSELREDLQDISEAVETVARRSDGLIKFVSSYRQLTRLPTLNKNKLKVASLFQQSCTLATQQWDKKGIQLQINIEPSELEISIDKDMLEQVLLNLLQNAEHAIENCPTPEVSLNAFLNKRGHVVIEVSDNGKGIPDEIGNKIFVPFYTTKQQGSGVGLALTRQIMLAHGGAIKYEIKETGGTVFRMTF